MMSILSPVLIVAFIGILAGLLLSMASVLMAVPKDERVEQLTEILPGANCGACGYSGCAGYAEALAKGKAQPGLCTVGGNEVAQRCAAILGVEADDVTPKAAVVQCLGICDNVAVKMNYEGFSSCAAAAQLYGGMNACRFGCIGLGDCAKECAYHAIELCNGIAIVDRNLCVGCGKCAKACPKQIIALTEKTEAAQVMCSNHDKGAVTRNACKAGCIGCMKCQKVCPMGAVTVENFLAKVNRELCINCLKCVEQCPTGAIHQML
ncbi:MAG: RnfABCDGE type electron transport complex subunit B [Clostridia bacterium]|nr:RnfABCDGE type electron transport complex subunit B [Clostridia bacterium]